MALFCSVLCFGQKKGFDPHAEHQNVLEHQAGKTVSAICVDYTDSSIVITDYTLKRKRYKINGNPYYIYPDAPSADAVYTKCDSVALVNVGDEQMLEIPLLCRYDGGKRLKLTRYLYSLQDNSLYSLDFDGTAIKPTKGEFCIEGVSSLALVEKNVYSTYLDSLFRVDARLEILSEADFKSDEYIEWWFENNPNAMKSAGTIEFGTISEDCSIYTAYKKAKKSTKGNLEAGVCDVRGYSVVIVRNKKTNAHLLVWAEPVCKNRKTQRYIAQVGFMDNNIVSIYFYKGKEMFKYRINLANRTLRK